MNRYERYDELVENIKQGKKGYDFKFMWINESYACFRTKDYKEIHIKTKVLKQCALCFTKDSTLKELCDKLVGRCFSLHDYIVYTYKVKEVA